jgi:short-subunit dehydrogenase
MKIDGAVAWVTGASSGIGEALAYGLSRRGARLILSARRAEALERVRAACTNPGAHIALPFDLADAGAIPAVAAQAIEQAGRVDLLVNNGGVSQRALAQDTTLDVDRRLMEVNYFSAVALTKAVLPSMLERGQGHIAVVSSIAGRVGPPYRTAYAASKHALHGFFDALRAEVWDAGLRVTIACPGFIRTNISVNALSGDGTLHGKMDDNQAEGLSPEACAEQIIQAIEGDRAEVLIGGKETLGVYLKRFTPGLLNVLLLKRKKA